MAEKRMFTTKIIDSDAFLDMPLSAQALYFHLNMRADDDGFVNNPKKIANYINASEDDLKLLILKRFIIQFESGVIVIKHWRMHNTLKNDRYHPTDYQEEYAKLGIKANKAYTDDPKQMLPPANGTKVEPERNQSGTKMEPQNSLREDIDKNSFSVDKISIDNGGAGGDRQPLTEEERTERINHFLNMYLHYKELKRDTKGVLSLAELEGITYADLKAAYEAKK